MVFAKNSTINSCTLETDISLRDHMHIAVESCFTGIGLRAKNYIQVLPGGFTRTHIFALLKKYRLQVTEIKLQTDSDRTPEQQKNNKTTGEHISTNLILY
ncbi:hypothetical protein [Megasphaera sueciensis]|uniref:hypothetical protein n=1 Tax=Megasphaera sueciensis TaxID=349094 RepID=UPI003CFEBBAD|nr:hypothetical protein [Megasphaera sp.]